MASLERANSAVCFRWHIAEKARTSFYGRARDERILNAGTSREIDAGRAASIQIKWSTWNESSTGAFSL